VKKLSLLSFFIVLFTLSFAQDKTKEQKKKEKNERINQMMKEEEEGALVYNKQSAFGARLNTDGYGIFYEHGKYKTISTTNIWWIELGERRDPKEKKSVLGDGSGIQIGNPFIYGKINNFYYLKLGYGQQRLIGGKDVKNGVAVSAIYGGGLALGFMKPYYLNVGNGDTSATIKYSDWPAYFLDPTVIQGNAGFTKGFSEITFVPGLHARMALRFDYGHFNELLSAIETGVNAAYYTKNIDMMYKVPGNKFFFNAYVAIVFGKRK
jgi:hypothetical protein